MTRSQALEAVRGLIPCLVIRGLAKDGDDYWTCEVELEDGTRGDVSMPDWYPEGFAVEWM